MMKIFMKDVHLKGCGTGISLPNVGNIVLNMEGGLIEDCKQAMEFRDPPHFLHRIGLPPNTPYDLLVEALTKLQAVSQETDNIKKKELTSTALFNWLGAGANSVTIAQGLIALQEKGLIERLITLLS